MKKSVKNAVAPDSKIASRKYFEVPLRLRKYLDLKIFAIILITLFVFIKYKSAFFVALFILINLILTYISREFEIFNPIKIMDFAVFMCAYAYGYKESFILAASALVLLPVAGKFTAYRLIMAFALFIQAVIGANLRFIDVSAAGIIVLSLNFLVQNLLNLALFHDFGTPSKIVKRVLDFIFWAAVYLLFGKQLFNIMS